MTLIKGERFDAYNDPAQKQEEKSRDATSISDENFKNIFPNAERED